MNRDTIFGWVGAIASIVAIIGALFGAYKYFVTPFVLNEDHFVGLYEGEAEGYTFELGVESTGGALLIGEVNFDSWDFVEVQLRGKFDSNQEVANFKFRRNEGHPLGPDEGEASISYNKQTKIYSGFWVSTKIPGNEQKWQLKKLSNEYSVKSWDG